MPITSPLPLSKATLLPAEGFLWLGMILLWAFTKILCAADSIFVQNSNVLPAFALGFLLLSIVLRFAVHSDESFALCCEGISLFLMSSSVMSPLAYVVTRSPMPAIDASLRALDMRLGFDAIHWHRLIFSSPRLFLLLMIPYASFLPQYLLALFLFPRTRYPKRGLELLRLSTLMLCVSYPLVYLFPAIGAVPAEESWASAWRILHDSSAPYYVDAARIQPIVSFPSFHVAMAVLLVYSVRGCRFWVRWPAWLLNLAMALSTSPMGCHYLVDLIEGACLTSATIIVARCFEHPERQRSKVPHFACDNTLGNQAIPLPLASAAARRQPGG